MEGAAKERKKKRLRSTEHSREQADDGTRTHDINLGKVALYH